MQGDLSKREAAWEFLCQGFAEEPKVCQNWDNWRFG